jgi:hypothetical protein
VAFDPALGVDAGQLVVEGSPEGSPQLARALCLVGDPADDVAAAAALGVLDGANGERFARPEVEHLEDDRRRPDVEGDAEQTRPLGIHVLAVPADAAVPDGDRRVDREGRPGRRHEDLQVPAQDHELEIALGRLAGHGRPTGEPVARAKKPLLLLGGRQRLPAPNDLHDALVAAAGSPTRSGDHHRQLVGRLEERRAHDERDAPTGVDEMTGHPDRIGATRPPATGLNGPRAGGRKDRGT